MILSTILINNNSLVKDITPEGKIKKLIKILLLFNSGWYIWVKLLFGDVHCSVYNVLPFTLVTLVTAEFLEASRA